MFRGGITTLYVSDFDRAIAFYTETLRLELRKRYECHWAEIVAGQDLVIGLHPIEGANVDTSTPGRMKIGLHVDGSLDEAVEALGARGVVFDGPIVEDGGAVRLAFFTDPDGNPLYLFELVEAATLA